MYAIHPGYIISLDSDEHYIGFTKLVELHHLNPKDCILWDNDKPYTFAGRKWKDYFHIFAHSYVGKED